MAYEQEEHRVSGIKKFRTPARTVSWDNTLNHNHVRRDSMYKSNFMVKTEIVVPMHIKPPSTLQDKHLCCWIPVNIYPVIAGNRSHMNTAIIPTMQRESCTF